MGASGRFFLSRAFLRKDVVSRLRIHSTFRAIDIAVERAQRRRKIREGYDAFISSIARPQKKLKAARSSPMLRSNLRDRPSCRLQLTDASQPKIFDCLAAFW
jgi:hypothetical protein